MDVTSGMLLIITIFCYDTRRHDLDRRKGVLVTNIPQESTYRNMELLAQEAFHLCLSGDIYHAQELLLRVRNALKRLSGDLPIVGYDALVSDSVDTPFVTQSLAEARAWGWLEIATGAFKLVENHPGASMVHFKRAWRIWRPWGMTTGNTVVVQQEARYERIRAGLWLGEAWARFMSERAQTNAQAILRASLKELGRLEPSPLLQETIEQQRHLPPALLGSPAYREDRQSVPYICSLSVDKEDL